MVERTIAEEVIALRVGQMIINERYRKKEFKIPIHLAFGHEAIAVAVSAMLRAEDRLILPHRNLHYNLLRSSSIRKILDEFLLREEGIASARGGSMNLANEDGGIVYTSSILGNNLSVAAGFALGNRVTRTDGVVVVVLGDGAMEEGAFYESLEFLKTFHLCALVIVENNGWSLATRISERRCNIDLGLFAESLGVQHVQLEGNDPSAYLQRLNQVRLEVLEAKRPVVVEVQLETLGDWRLKTPEHPDGKYVNYHAGPAPTVALEEWPVIREDDTDPVYLLSRQLGREKVEEMARQALNRMEEALK